MLDASDLIDNIVTVLQSNSDLVALLANQSVDSIFPYYSDDADGTNLEQRVEQQSMGTVMVAWRGTRTGVFARMEATKHDFTCYLKPIGRATALFKSLLDSTCSATGTRFRFSTINPKVNPPENVSLVPQPMIIGGGVYVIYDTMPVSFTLTERGVDN